MDPLNTGMNEASLVHLYDSTVKAFPKTQFRQHATHTIRFPKLDLLPFLGVKTLFVKGLAQNEGREYSTYIVFKNVNYKPEDKIDLVEITGSDGLPYKFKKLIAEKHDVLVRCSCPDFKWRWSYWDGQQKCLYGAKPKPYDPVSNRGPANPLELEGMCKHTLKLVEALKDAGILTS
jgi:hypothetical protein